MLVNQEANKVSCARLSIFDRPTSKTVKPGPKQFWMAGAGAWNF